ncbi:hypothetical protein GH141_06360 [bacterium]|nr:hypothetical protein [bacterium]
MKPETPVQYLKGIGPKRAARLSKLGINTVEDLLFHLPSRYIDRSNPVPIASAQIGQEATFVVKVMGSTFRRSRRGPLVQILVADESAQMYVVWFNRPDLRGRFKPGDLLRSDADGEPLLRAAGCEPGFLREADLSGVPFDRGSCRMGGAQGRKPRVG